MNKTLRAKADKLFKEACFEKYGEKCELCGGTFRNTAHHYFYRSSCSHLRYDLDNGVILCCQCHAKLHFKDPKIVEEQIIAKRGRRWINRLIKKSKTIPKYYKFNDHFILKAIELL